MQIISQFLRFFYQQSERINNTLCTRPCNSYLDLPFFSRAPKFSAFHNSLVTWSRKLKQENREKREIEERARETMFELFNQIKLNKYTWIVFKNDWCYSCNHEETCLWWEQLVVVVRIGSANNKYITCHCKKRRRRRQQQQQQGQDQIVTAVWQRVCPLLESRATRTVFPTHPRRGSRRCGFVARPRSAW